MTQTLSGTRKSYCQPQSSASESAPEGTTRPLQRCAVLAVGWILVLAGGIGLILPVVPGGILLVAGVLVLSPYCAWIRRAEEKYGACFRVPGRLVTCLAVLGRRVDRARLAVRMAIRKHFLEVR